MSSEKRLNEPQKRQDLPKVDQTAPKKDRARPAQNKSIPLKRQDVLILVTVWLVGCFVVAGLVGLFYSQTKVAEPDQPRPTAEFNVLFAGDTAKTAYLLARAKAQNWQGDVELVVASANWSNAAIEDLGQAGAWEFSFFSVGHQRMFFVLTDANQQTIGQSPPHKLRRPPRLINPADWIIDSDEAISIWVNNGGGIFLETFPDNMVEMLLRQAPGTGRPVWNIIGASADQSQLFYLAIDATNRQILN